jgi:DNA-binding NtrC family response regulator
MKITFMGLGNQQLISFAMDTRDDSIINLTALAKKLGCARSTLFDRIQDYGWDSAIRHFIKIKNQKKLTN